MKVEIQLSADSCNKAVDALKQYKEGIKPKLDELCRRLAEIGADEARRRFARGDHGNGGVIVEPPVKIENGYKIVASGHDVYFIEFGTGVFAGVGYGNGMPLTSVPVYPGSWSEEHAQKFSEYGYWWYGGERLEGTEAEMPMFYAGQAIRANERRIAKEVFG